MPYVISTTPAADDNGVYPGTFVTASLYRVDEGIPDDPAMLDANVRLYRGDETVPLPAIVNTSPAGDVLTLQPITRLEPHTRYRFEVSEGLQDRAGRPFQRYQMSFTTGEDVPPPPSPVGFEAVPLPHATGRRFTGLALGPDGRLYAGTMEGEIVRFDVLGDGDLGPPTVISTVRQHNSGAKRIITGLRFDPGSTRSNLVLWITHGHGAEENAPDWTSKLSRLAGADLGEYQDYVVGLPRAVRDHLTQQMDFKPGTRLLFISQGSNNAMGAPDGAWGYREERLLTAAVLRVDTDALEQHVIATDKPLDVHTEDAAPYDPFAEGAPVTLYATGVRNSFDLVWHSNGHLYAPTNGSAAGGNTPTGGGVDGLSNVSKSEPDWLFRVREGGYYGHPNPTRDEFVLNGGNPTAGKDPHEVSDYPVGVERDPRWDPPVHEFGTSVSPTGVIEYKSHQTFGGALAGSLVICRYAGGDGLVSLKPDATGDIPPEADATREFFPHEIAGTRGLDDPVDVVENVGPGTLYVTEYRTGRITLLRPMNLVPHKVGRAVFNDPVGDSPSPVRKLTVRNTTAAPFPVADIQVVGDGADRFDIVDEPGLPTTLEPGESLHVSVAFDPPPDMSPGVTAAVLRLSARDAATAPLDLSLRGLATAGEGGSLEPSLQRVFDLFELPIRTGDPDPSTPEMPLDQLLENDAVAVERLVKAGDGAVSVDPLAVFAQPGSPTIRFGYYAPASQAEAEILTVADSSQRTRPPFGGATSFEPGGAAFGLYAAAPGAGNTAYTEDALNTFEPDESLRRKALLFPLSEWDGIPVENAFVVAFEEVPGAGDFQDFVVIVRNVRAADPPVEPEPDLSVTHDGAELNDGAGIPFGAVTAGGARPQRTIVIHNRGDADLSLGEVQVPPGFEPAGTPPAGPLAPGSSADLVVAMSTDAPGAADGTLVIPSNDPDEEAFTLLLSGTVEPLPPVMITRVTGGLPPVVVGGARGARGVMQVTVRNSAASKFVGHVSVSVVAAEPGGSGAVALGGTEKSVRLAGGAEKLIQVKVALRPSLAEGGRDVTVSVTANGESHAMPGGGFQVARPTLRTGRRETVVAAVTNPLATPVSSLPVTYHVTVAAAADASGTVHQAATSARLSLKPGAALAQKLSFTLPTAVPPGDYFLTVRLTPGLDAAEPQTLLTMPVHVA